MPIHSFHCRGKKSRRLGHQVRSRFETQIAANAIENCIITGALTSLSALIDSYRGDAVLELDEDHSNHD